MAAPFFTSLPSSSPLSEGATPMVTMTFVKGSVKKGAAITSLKKWIRAVLNFIALIPPRSIRQMLANFSGVEF